MCYNSRVHYREDVLRIKISFYMMLIITILFYIPSLVFSTNHFHAITIFGAISSALVTGALAVRYVKEMGGTDK